jgi:hypothetical protein
MLGTGEDCIDTTQGYGATRRRRSSLRRALGRRARAQAESCTKVPVRLLSMKPSTRCSLDPVAEDRTFKCRVENRTIVRWRRGYFDDVSTTADVDPDHPETSSVMVTISSKSIRTTTALGTTISGPEFPGSGELPGD